MRKRKPATSRVPRASIVWHVGRFHVGTSDEELEADIRERCARAGATEAETREAVEIALEAHRDNQRLYDRVMRGIL